jgi:hypothetical protein
MNWIQRWMDRRRVKDLKIKIAQMKTEAEAAELDHLMLSACTISQRIQLLEKAVDKLESQHPADQR